MAKKAKSKRGGAREGAGRPKEEETKVIRVPLSKLDQVKKIIKEK